MAEQHLTTSQKKEFCLMLSIGCDRQTAGHYTGVSAAALAQAVHHDREFGDQILRAEAASEFHHMRNIYQATKDEKHWRASVWWLERRAPDRFEKRLPDIPTTTQLQNIIEQIATVMLSEVHDEDTRRRLMVRLEELDEQFFGQSFKQRAERPRQSGDSVLQIEHEESQGNLSNAQ